MLALGCVGPAEGSTVHEGVHLRVYEDPGALPICPGSVADADHFLARTAEYLGVEPGTHEYYYRAHLGFDECGGRGGCAPFGVVASTQWIHHHEMVHLIAPSQGPTLLTEGLADAITTAHQLTEREAEAAMAAPLERALDSSTFRADRSREIDMYRAGALFVRYLLRRFGPPQLMQWRARTPAVADPSVAATTFQQVYGLELSEVIEAYRASDPSELVVPPQGFRWRTCDEPTMTLTDGSTGPQRASLRACAWSQSAFLDGVQQAGIEVPVGGLHRLSVTDRRQVATRLARCEGDSPYPLARQLQVAPITDGELHDLPPGRVFVLMNMRDEAARPVELTWEVSRLGPSDASTCADAPRVPIGGAEDALRYYTDPQLWEAVRLASGRVARRTTLVVQAERSGVLYLQDWEGRLESFAVCDCAESCLLQGSFGETSLGWVEAGTELELRLQAHPGGTRGSLRFELR